MIACLHNVKDHFTLLLVSSLSHWSLGGGLPRR